MSLNRRQFLSSSSLALASAVLLPRGSVLAQEGNAFELIRRGVGTFVGRGGTIGWLASAEALVVVDSQMTATAGDCLSGLRERSAHALDALINTHHHGDHTGGNGVFREAAGKIVAHDNVPALQKQAAKQRGSEDDQTYADTTFAKSWRHEAGDEIVTATHYGPAHTGGDSVVHFEKADVVHMGDLVFNRWYPFIDRPGGASVAGWIDVLGQVLDKHGDQATYVFGHGKTVVGKHSDVAHQRNYFSALLEITQKGIRQGKSAEEIAALGSLKGFEEHETLGERLSLAHNVAMAHEELTADR